MNKIHLHPAFTPPWTTSGALTRKRSGTLDPGDIIVHKIMCTDTHNIVVYDTDDVLLHRTLWATENSSSHGHSREISTVEGRAIYLMHIPPTVSPRTSCQLIHALLRFNEDGNQQLYLVSVHFMLKGPFYHSAQREP